MPAGDSSPPDKRNTRPDPTNRNATSPDEPVTENPDDSVDFGSYVSSTVRSSAEMFGTPARSAPSRSRKPRASTPPANETDVPRSEAPLTPTSRESPVESRNRPRTYWRDSVAGDDRDEVDAGGDDGRGDDGGRRGDLFPWKFPEGDRTRKLILAGAALAILAVIVIIWLLNRGEDDETPPPTGTVESILDVPSSATESADDPSTPPAFLPQDDDTPAPPTEGVRRGGDNQRNRDDSSTPGASGLDGSLAGIELGLVASQCPERCLVRIAGGPELDSLLSTAGTRPSFATNEWAWAVASPQGIAWLEQNAETTLVSTSSDSLPLYMARVPDDAASDSQVESFGTVLDSAGPWRLMESSTVPAIVKPLTDWGYQVDKLAPAPPTEWSLPEELTPISSIEIGALLDDVRSDAIERSIEDLVAMGSPDGSEPGTRYYTAPANMEAAEYLFRQLESYGLDVWYEDFLSWEGYLMVNVIGEVSGADDSAVYGVMAHFDSISENLGIAPGADDNASGVAASLEIARILGQYELNHPLRVIFVNVEEVGIVGSQEFAKRANAEGTAYEGVFNLDSIGAARQYNYLVLNGNGDTQWMADLYVRINDAYGLGQSINAMSNDAIVADDNRLREAGIDSMMVARELYGQSPFHHTSGDTIDTISIAGVVSCSQLTLLSLAALVQA